MRDHPKEVKKKRANLKKSMETPDSISVQTGNPHGKEG